jgi:hypothetical protein
MNVGWYRFAKVQSPRTCQHAKIYKGNKGNGEWAKQGNRKPDLHIDVRGSSTMELALIELDDDRTAPNGSGVLRVASQ